MKILLVSEYAQRGSGYTTIADGLLGEWEKRGHQVTMLAFDYKGFEHPHAAAIIPTDPRIIRNQAPMIARGFQPDAIVVAFDLSFHHSLQAFMQMGAVYCGIFPVEADPVYHPSDWTLLIDQMDVAFCESRFGTAELQRVGLRATWMPVGIDPFFRPPSIVERESARQRWNLEDRFVVYTVADNQERKNLPAHFAAVAIAQGQKVEWPPLSGSTKALRFPLDQRPIEDIFWVLNTKKRKASLGLDFFELTQRYGLADHALVLEHDREGGLSREELRDLYWSADAFLLLSKAEGLGLPVLEAMACGVPVVGTDCTGIAESLGEGRGFLVRPEYVHIDPFGNQYRRWADPLQAARFLTRIKAAPPRFRHTYAPAMGEKLGMVDAAVKASRKYVTAFTWARAADVIEKELDSAIKSRTPAPAEASV